MKILAFLAAQAIACFLVVAAHAQSISPPNLANVITTAPPANALGSGDLLAVVQDSLLKNVPADSLLNLNTITPPNSNANWLNANNVNGKNPYGYLSKFGYLVLPTPFGEPAVVGAAETLDTPSPNTCCAIGLAGVSITNTSAPGSWPLYTTGVRLPGGGSVNNEFDIANGDALVDVSVLSGPIVGSSGGLALNAGGEPFDVSIGAYPPCVTSGPCAHPSSYALGIWNNGTTWQHGIVIGKNAIDAASNHAIDLYSTHQIVWTNAAGAISGQIGVTNPNGLTDLLSQDFGEFGVNWKDQNGATNFTIGNNAGATIVNHLVVQGSATGVAPHLFAQGTDTDVDIRLLPQGAGMIAVGNCCVANSNVATAMSSVGPAGSHTTIQEWLAIKDGAGIVRYIPLF